MSSGMRRGWLVLGLALSASAFGCGSDDDPDEIVIDSGVVFPVDGSAPEAGRADGGGSDASSTNDASTPSMDAGSSAMDASSTMDTSTATDTSMPDTSTEPDASSTCPTDCTGVMIGSVMVRACCAGGGDAGPASCGLNAEDLKLASPTSPFTGCVPKEVARASESAYCGEIWDQVERSGKDNGGLDLKAGEIEVVYDGCCLPSGECGAYFREPRAPSVGDAGADAGDAGDAGPASGVDLHLGCVSYARVRAALTLPDGGTPATPSNQPFCNPSNGQAVTEGTVPGVPKFVCGCGEDVQPEEGAVPTCLANFPEEVCGRDDPDAATLATIPEYICGCSDASSTAVPCLRNVEPSVCGTKAISNSSAELDKLPEYICGCGPTTRDPGAVVACLSNVETNVCGKTNITTAGAISALPEFLCGCGNGKAYDLEQVRCLSNVDAALCGGKNITEPNDSSLIKVPEFLCGCGENVPYNQQPLPCLPKVKLGVCGALDVTGSTHPDLAKLPAFICGCGNSNVYNNGPNLCLSNVAPEVCGGLAITNGNSPWLNPIPTYRCGCNGASFQYIGCLANTSSNICGRAAVQIDNKGTAGNENDDCLTGIPEYVRGCGTSTSPTAQNPNCLNRTRNIPGCVDTEVDTKGTETTTDDCLEGVPEYQRGCGETTGTSSNGCLPLAGAFWGCDQVTTSVPNVREYICGCGDGVVQPANPAYPCLSNVAHTVCGAVPVTRSQEVTGVLNTICGCGDGVVTGANCVRNVPPGVCGATATCTKDGGQYNCPGLFVECQDNYGTNASGAKGDGILDTCP